MELKYSGKKIVAAVAQQPFSYGPNTFCKLIPLFNHLDRYDKVLDAKEFYNDGEIWWRLSSNTNPKSITPGTMVEISVEPSQDSNTSDPNKSLYQAKFMSREEPIDASAGAELFRPVRETAKTLLRIKGNGAEVSFPHCPAKEIYLYVEGYVYGPFATLTPVVSQGAISGNFKVKSMSVRNGIGVLYRIKYSEFVARYHVLKAEIRVSLDEKGSRLSNLQQSVSYEYLPPEECAAIAADRGSAWEELDWEPLAAKFSRMAGAVKSFTRQKKQQLKNLVQELEDSADTGELAENFKTVTSGIRKLAEDEENAFRELAVAVMESDTLTEPRFKKAMDEFLRRYVENHRDELEADLADLKEEVEDLDRRCEDERRRLDREREQRKVEQKKESDRLKQQLDKQKDAARREIDAERKKWQDEHAKREAALMESRRHVDEVLEEIKTRINKNAADCLLMFPFLKEMGLGTAPQKVEISGPTKRSAIEPFVIPPNVYVPMPGGKKAVAEMSFLEKVRNYASSCGLSYDINDIRRFHVSVLCEDLTILEGPSGVGKSSLARVYGDVVAGEGAEYPRNGTHVVHVSPSWIERADLLGYVNTVTAEFSPSETGLYQHLIMADADMKSNGGGSALYPICLDEMNLAQVEHYFSDFMQILEMPVAKRVLKCFSKDAVSSAAVFRNYATVALVPSIRFIGTVNFDETTRRLSSRLLDRANLVYLNDQPKVRALGGKEGSDAGCGVSYETFISWRKNASLSATVEKLLETLSDPLRKLGTAVSPRVRDAMGRYIASAIPLMSYGDRSEAVAFDEQLAQRVLSKVRSITSITQKKALDSIAAIVDGIRDADYSPSAMAIERLRSREHFFGYESDSTAQ